MSTEIVSPQVVFEDRQLIVVIKPNGYLSQGDFSDRLDILEWCRSRVAANRPAGGHPFVGLCHRLDRQVGGLMVVAKTSKAASRISAQFRDRTIEKIYSALCLGVFGEREGELRQSLTRDGRLTRLSEKGENGTEAILSYQVAASGFIGETRVSKLLVKLFTGFKHQIRAQLASIGHPVYGDFLYGAPGAPEGIEAIALCSSHLSFIHPISREKLAFDCSLDGFWPFGDFIAD
ncbi:MAG: RluA family pseudouridine synthase [Deltaproteobacteria bacterium]|nr:RluA family pseudouridine synthase [Deltaproteobacteria bacterium]